jgi:hypothetical protein
MLVDDGAAGRPKRMYIGFVRLYDSERRPVGLVVVGGDDHVICGIARIRARSSII